MKWLLILLLLASPALPLPAADAPAQVEESQKAPLFGNLIDSLKGATTDVNKLNDELKRATTPEAKLEIQGRIDAGRARIHQLRENLRDIIGGAEAAEYEGFATSASNVQQQIGDLLEPILGELRDATSRPRELDVLHKSLDLWLDRKRKAATIVARIDDVATTNTDKVLAAELVSARQLWTGRQGEAEGQIAVLKSRIGEREDHQESLWGTISRVFSRFFRSRGVNLLLALLAGVLGFVVTRQCYLWLRGISPLHRGDQRSLTGRISDILAVVTAAAVAFCGVMLVLYVRGDWLLLTLAIVFLFGLAWAGKTALPPYIQQLRMLLNLGSVREGERVIYQGLPWKVARIGVFTRFINPHLQGGTLRIPVRDLMAMTSREADPKEPWFPTDADDWVVLSGGTYGKIITQTPEQVVLLQLGGSLKTYSTAAFLSQCPEKLSCGFRITGVFGIDYRHQADATGSVVERLSHAITTDLVGEFGREGVRSVKVEFAAAAASSLDYRILADFDGSMAPKYRALERRIQKVCLEACNTHGWVIPFTQITVHQAEG